MQATNATKPTQVPGLTLHVYAGDRDRFARLFRSTWLQIPNKDPSQDDGGLSPGPDAPRVNGWMVELVAGP